MHYRRYKDIQYVADSTEVQLQFKRQATEIRKKVASDFISETATRNTCLEVLGLADPPKADTQFNKNFSEELVRTKIGYYKTRLPWKSDILALPDNKELATARLCSTTRRLEHIGKLYAFNEAMQEQLQEGILEGLPTKPLLATPTCYPC